MSVLSARDEETEAQSGRSIELINQETLWVILELILGVSGNTQGSGNLYWYFFKEMALQMERARRWEVEAAAIGVLEFVVVCSSAWSTAEQFTAQINKQLKFCSKGRTEMNTQWYRKTNQFWEQQRGWDPGFDMAQWVGGSRLLAKLCDNIKNVEYQSRPTSQIHRGGSE